MKEHLRSNRKSDVKLANLAFDTVMKVRSEGRKKHPDDDGDFESVNFHLMRGATHCALAVSPLETEVCMQIEHMLVRATMGLLKHKEE